METLYIIVLFLSLVALLISMLCRSLVHKLLHNYKETKIVLERIFKKRLDNQWWDPRKSSANKYGINWTVKFFWGDRIKFLIPVQFSDSFHTFNTIELGGYDFIISSTISIILNSILPWDFIFYFFISFGLIGFLIVLFFNYGYDILWTDRDNK